MKNKILPVFISFAGCTSKCVYCNQHKITGVKPSEVISSAEKQIKECIAMDVEWTELAFYGGSFTCLPDEITDELYKLAKNSGVDKLRFSTSPDCINKHVLAKALNNGVETVEIGVQSLNDDVLALNKRPYKTSECLEAVRLTKSMVTKTGIQLMVGMYGETPVNFYDTVDTAVDMGADYARIYPTVVLEDTELADLYRLGSYKPVSLHEAVGRAAYAYILLMASGCDVIRVGLHDSNSVRDSVVAGAYHPAMGDMVKTVAMQTFFENDGSMKIAQEYLNIAYGYKSYLRNVCSDKVEIVEGVKPDFIKISKEILRLLGEDYKRKLQRQTVVYAKGLVDKANNG